MGYLRFVLRLCRRLGARRAASLDKALTVADQIDIANDLSLAENARAVAEARDKASQIPAGIAGDCDLCGNWSGRLVGGACAPCRDRYRLP